MIETLIEQIRSLPTLKIYGTVNAVQGLMITVSLKNKILSLGSRCYIHLENGTITPGEVVGFQDEQVLIMPFGSLIGISPGCQVIFEAGVSSVKPDKSWCGRIINAMAEPIDNLGPLKQGAQPYPLQSLPLPSGQRARVHQRIDVGVRAINTFLTCCKGQRLGIFAGSGVGKSVLMSMLARYTACDIAIIGLIGERGREVKEFIEEALGEEGLKKSIVVVATSDEPALNRRQAAYLTLTIAEYFRDMGLSVLCMMDSVTRFAMAQREIGLSAGEPPTTKGYPPSVFAELPKLLERAGPGLDKPQSGFITAFFTVLVDGDDHNEPIADTVRGILDGHIVLERNIAERGRFPAINILKSISRMVPNCHEIEEYQCVKKAKKTLSIYEDMADMIRLGAYRSGSNLEVDLAISLYPLLDAFLAQDKNEYASLDDAFEKLKEIVAEI